MAASSRPDAAFFTLPRIEAILAWGAARPQGFSVRIIADHEDYPELAVLCRHGTTSPLWLLHATQAGTVVITNASGAHQEFGTVEAALARVLELERLTLVRAQRGWRRLLRFHGL